MGSNIHNYLPELSRANSRIDMGQLKMKQYDIEFLCRFIIIILRNQFPYLL